MLYIIYNLHQFIDNDTFALLFTIYLVMKPYPEILVNQIHFFSSLNPVGNGSYKVSISSRE